ncbi:MAG: hypothetical protein KKB82_01225 [Candidatus Omnitrophica bacterium]|nr:hypothetical protein [Candidatus Omnitrophota bacterium]MBU1924524.1 hypothetical protein [Candidatus Omnitrophota bacterium]
MTMIKKQITEIKNRDPLTERIIACAYKVHSEYGLIVVIFINRSNQA